MRGVRNLVPAILLLALTTACGPSPEEQVEEIADDQVERLASLGYVDWSEPLGPGERGRSGVVLDTDRAHPGYSLYTSLPSRTAQLLDMSGAVVHTWTAPDDGARPWHHVEMTARGELFGVDGGPLQKLDWHSRLIWQADFRAHHDLDIGPDGRIYALGMRVRRVGETGTRIIDDEIVVLAPDGTILERIAFSDVFEAVLFPARLRRIEAFLKGRGLEEASDEEILAKRGWTTPDVFHANSVERLQRDVPHLGSEGDLLVSMRSMNRVAVIDLQAGAAVWSWGDVVLDRPHHASLLPDGRVSVFDNGWHRKASRVLHVDPLRGIRWRYPLEPDPEFFSQRRGGAQRLPNGNVLITESQDGRAFEVDAAGEIVWEFLNPEVDPGSNRRARIYRMQRIERDLVDALLARPPLP